MARSPSTGTQTQKELEATVKGYQLKEVKDELIEIKGVLKEIQTNTTGVVSFQDMKIYVDERIDDKIAPLVLFKANTTKLTWILLGLIITDIGTRILQGLR